MRGYAPDRDPQLALIEALLIRVLAHVERLNALTVQQQKTSRRALRDADKAALVAMLPAWFDATNGSPSRASEIARYGPPGISVRALGKLLARTEGIPVNGLAVERRGTEGNAVLWGVVLAL